jgi:hypothetical protein
MPEAICKCGATAVHATDPARCERGHNLVGHPGPAWKNGVRQFEQHGERVLAPDLRGSINEFRDAVIADRGGVENLTAIEAGYVRRLVELETVVRLLASDLAARGIFTARGRARSTVAHWLATLDRWDRFALRVGIERRARRVPTLHDVLSGDTHAQDPS